MNTRRLSFAVIVIVAACAGQVLGASNLILNVPDWNQPAPAGYAGWCSPTAGGNLFGYWEDVNGCVGLTDRQVPPGAAAYANNPNTFKQGLYQDGQVELGFFMGTDGWVNPNTQLPPNTINGTPVNNIGPGLFNYANASWIDPGLIGITKVAWTMTALSIGKDNAFGAQTWANYKAEIDASRPALATFDSWVGVPNGVTHLVNGQTVHEYSLDATDPHTVVGVGYLDLNPLAFGQELIPNAGDEWVIAQDGWGNTPQYIAVQFTQRWMQNDYVYDVPEPATLSLLALGGLALIRRRRK